MLVYKVILTFAKLFLIIYLQICPLELVKYNKVLLFGMSLFGKTINKLTYLFINTLQVSFGNLSLLIYNELLQHFNIY